jgi:glycyl-tRNA synthetase beta chain
MRDHQKYFAVEGADGKLAPHFLAVLNTQVDDTGSAIIRHGNARVLRARFKDAQFFWDFDQKTPLTERVQSLEHVTFFRQQGQDNWSYASKTEENEKVAGKLAKLVEAAGTTFDEAALRKAVKLAKTDLTCELVKEFTELQGVIGGLYAKAQCLGDIVGEAIYDQYVPASTEDRIPKTVEGQILGLADRIQTITFMFGAGHEPTGSKDPFALRRAANAIVKILAESELPLTVGSVINAGSETFNELGRKGKLNLTAGYGAVGFDFDSDQTSNFMRERLHFYLKDVRGFAYDVVNAVLAAGADDVRDAIARAEALTAARESADFAAISTAFKRMKNILRQVEEKHFETGSAEGAILSQEAQQLFKAAAALEPDVAQLRQQRAYVEALVAIATLRPAVDAFFDKVMVLDPDPAIRGAHLGLIAQVLRGFSGIADFSEIVTN